MQPRETVSGSSLDKPLHQLTEDDISQLTREDCRRYLKKKGMRRPSWNKSQAIQQVISLKALLETMPDSEATDTRKRLYIPCSDNPPRASANSSVSAKGTRADTTFSVSADESVPCPRHDPSKPDFPVDSTVRFAANDSVSPRTTGAANEPAGQMTIFYRGKVNVYNGVPLHKAGAIMKLAASPIPLPHEVSFNIIPVLQTFTCQLETTGVKATTSSPMVLLPIPQTVKVTKSCELPGEESNIFHENSLDGTISRKASVLRYREKRKERFKSKRKVTMPSTTGLDINLNHHMGNPITNAHWNTSYACSPHPRPPQTPSRCSSLENIAKNANLLGDFNDKDVQDVECEDDEATIM